MEELTVGAVARLVGVTVRTLHHRDEIGLVRPSARAWSGYRLYDAADIARIHRVLVYREVGMPLARIAEVLEPSRRALDSATSSFSEAWRALDEDISALVRTTSAAGIDELAKDLKARLTDLAASLKLPGIDDMSAQLRAFAALSRSLRPAAETMTRTLSVMDAVKRSAGTWAEGL